MEQLRGRIRPVTSHLVALACMLVAGPAMAQGFGGTAALTAVDIPMAVMTKSLTLSADQATQITTIQKDYRTTRQRLMPPRGQTLDPDAMKAVQTKIAAAQKDANDKITAILTDDQKAKLPQLLTDATDFRDVNIPLELGLQLQLTADERQKVSDIAANERKDVAALTTGDNAITDRRALRAQTNQLRQAAHASVLAILTDVQKAQVDQYAKDHPAPQRSGGGGGGATPPAPPAAGA